MEIYPLSVKSLLQRRLFSFLLVSLFPVLGLSSSLGLQADSPPSPVVFSVGSFSFPRPEGWIWVPPTSSIRKAELNIPSSVPGVAPATVTFFCFGPGEGGSVQANVDRWTRQFSNPDGSPVKAVTESRRDNLTDVTLVTASGLFSSGMDRNSSTTQARTGLRGAILQSTQGDVYVKMTGPEALVSSSAKAFEDMIHSACTEPSPR